MNIINIYNIAWRAYVELNEILKVLSKEQKEKIPPVFIKSLEDNADSTYHFQYDMNKTILEQKLY